jgi:Cytochrome c554 and c-prime
MPASARPPDELWALADFLLQLRQRAAAEAAARPLAPPRLGALHPEAIVADRLARLPAGTWPGRGEAASILFGGVIALQGPPPPQLAPAQARLSARQCARCHASQYRQWSGSLHAAAASPGLLAQLLRTGKGELPAKDVAGCQRCHAPLPEQTEAWPRTADAAAPWLPNPAFDAELRHQGITCAACHVRGWRRFGPPHLAASLLPLPGYPRTELAVYQRGDFCLPCHQLPARQALEGRPLLNTYKEWLDGPYFRRGIQCQHCHMPNREHTFRGVHDPDTFRQGVAVTGTAVRAPRPPDDSVTVRVAVTNAGAGHYLPTTPTPAAWLTIELLDGAGAPIAGAVSRTRIGRHIAYVGGAWRELEDTRIAPGETRTIARAWRAGRVAHARAARLRLEVHPDEYYERFYRLRLAAERHPEARAGYASALARAEANRYVALTIELPIEPTIEPTAELPIGQPGR